MNLTNQHNPTEEMGYLFHCNLLFASLKCVAHRDCIEVGVCVLHLQQCRQGMSTSRNRLDTHAWQAITDTFLKGTQSQNYKHNRICTTIFKVLFILPLWNYGGATHSFLWTKDASDRRCVCPAHPILRRLINIAMRGCRIFPCHFGPYRT